MNGLASSSNAYNAAIANDLRLQALLGFDDDNAENSGFGTLLESLAGGSGRKAVYATQAVNTAMGSGMGIPAGGMDALLSMQEVSPFTMAAPGLYPATLKNRDYLEALIGSSGPLPNFLRHVVAERNLNAAQTQSLYEIAARNMDIQKTPEAIAKLAKELDAAGI